MPVVGGACAATRLAEDAMTPHPGTLEREVLHARLGELWERTGDAALGRLSEGKSPFEGAAFDTPQHRDDWVSTCLMESYRTTQDGAVFSLLFELNRASFQHAIESKLRRVHVPVDAQDVLQDAFLNIYRYPHRFHADRPDAFRNWGHRIVQNTLLKFLKGQARMSRQLHLDDEDQVLPADEHALPPDRVASEHEGAELVNHAFLLFLNLYLLHYEQLSEREKLALRLVEVEDVPYRTAAEQLGIRLENLKMVVFRGRQRIYRGMHQSLERMHAGKPVLPSSN